MKRREPRLFGLLCECSGTVNARARLAPNTDTAAGSIFSLCRNLSGFYAIEPQEARRDRQAYLLKCGGRVFDSGTEDRAAWSPTLFKNPVSDERWVRSGRQPCFGSIEGHWPRETTPLALKTVCNRLRRKLMVRAPRICSYCWRHWLFVSGGTTALPLALLPDMVVVTQFK